MMRNSCYRRLLAGRHEGWEHGQTLVIAALLMVVLIGALALVVDVGNAYTQRRLAQNAADAAALAGVRALALDHTAAEIDATVEEYAVQRNPGQSYEMAVVDQGVAVTITKTFPTYFAAVIGTPAMTVVAVAEGVYTYTEAMSGLAPIAVQKDAVEAAGEDKLVQIWDDDKTPSSPGIISGGDRGWLNLNNDPNLAAKSLVEWIIDGYSGQIDTAQSCADSGSTDPNCSWIIGSPGSKVTAVDEVQKQYENQPKFLIVPVYDVVRQTEIAPGSPSMLDYHIVAFASFQVTKVWKDTEPGSGEIKKIQGKFEEYVAIGHISDNPELDYGVRVIGLRR